MPDRPTVVFVTDYGVEDAYAASLAGAAWRTASSVRCVAGTHGVPPGDVLAGAYHVKAVSRAFAPGTAICAVVDPAVGTGRRCLAASVGGFLFVGPDNGLISYLWDEADPAARAAVELAVPDTASPTFAGRDLFAPVAATLAAGQALGSCGPSLGDPVLLPEAFARREGGSIDGCVAVVDHFGNAITTVRESDLDGRRPISARWRNGELTTVARTYDELGEGLGLILGSAGHLEVAARRVRAVDLGAPDRHEPVHVELAT